MTDEEGVEVDHPEKDRFRGLFAGHDEDVATLFASTRVILSHFFQVLQEGESGALFTVTQDLLEARYERSDFDAHIPSFQSPEVASERRAVVEMCCMDDRLELRFSSAFQRRTLRTFVTPDACRMVTDRC